MNTKYRNTPFNILLADDDIDDCLFFTEALQKLPYLTQLTTVHDGDELMITLRDESKELPHAVFLNYMMPRKNGLECLTEIKRCERIMHLPIIILSTSIPQDVINELHEKGALYFIRKPAKFAQLKRIIEETLSHFTIAEMPATAKEDFVLTLQDDIAA